MTLRLRGPRLTRHVLSSEQLDALSLPIGDDGVAVGVDARGGPAVMGFHHPRPFEVLLIGGLWTAQVLALRLAATGARIAVETGRPQVWTTLLHAVGGEGGVQGAMTVYDVGRVPALGATVGSPVVVIRDCGMKPPRGRVSSAPWQSVLTLLPYLSPVAPRLLRGAALTGVQRVSPQEARQLGRMLTLSDPEVQALPSLGDGVTLWCAPKDRQFAKIQPTDAETGLLGVARRLD
ncbi:MULTISPECIES: hypothetical protein [unclassified Streptomyces]|uniref:hypothetical protein n=1 Tax=unclassified Streptomyces TaxID=2593676 RepID=UPI0022B617E7|nr:MULTISPECIES: hypothetical protein [unclassified Streptomyces]MCZ7416198.1 hypothetical protein [Streptomyces sp. WMMC897]MCZ7433993.1 hypothetical protein [Streptomyces sp. WMMC1477]